MLLTEGVFSDGKCDAELVAQILTTAALRRGLHACLQAWDVVGVKEISEDDLLAAGSGFSTTDLAN